jgi:hypothetical protein
MNLSYMTILGIGVHLLSVGDIMSILQKALFGEVQGLGEPKHLLISIGWN